MLQSESDAAFGGAFLSLRKRTGDNNSEQSWKLGIPSGQRFIALHRFKLWYVQFWVSSVSAIVVEFAFVRVVAFYFYLNFGQITQDE